MKVRKNNFVWLFAFADLAFLLLISFTQIPETRIQKIPLPQVPQKEGQLLTSTPTPHLKLFVFETPSGESRPAPFQLGTFLGEERVAESPRLSEKQLLPKLKELFKPHQPGPVLWPHPSARTEDLLTAYVMIQQVWRGEEVVIAIKPKEEDQGPRQ